MKKYKTAAELRASITETLKAYDALRDALGSGFLSDRATAQMEAIDWIDCAFSPYDIPEADDAVTLEQAAASIEKTVNELISDRRKMSYRFDVRAAREMQRWAIFNLAPEIREGRPALNSGYKPMNEALEATK